MDRSYHPGSHGVLAGGVARRVLAREFGRVRLARRLFDRWERPDLLTSAGAEVAEPTGRRQNARLNRADEAIVGVHGTPVLHARRVEVAHQRQSTVIRHIAE